jgi:filamentous hemagglutinin
VDHDRLGTGKRYQTFYPRGEGAANGPLPKGYVMVSRWISAPEVKLWWNNGGTFVPSEVGRDSGRVSVIRCGGGVPPGVVPGANIRLDFAYPEAGLFAGGSGLLIYQPVTHVPIHNVSIHLPLGLEMDTVLKNRGI